MGMQIVSPLSSFHAFYDGNKGEIQEYDFVKAKIYEFFPYDEKANDILYQCCGNCILVVISSRNAGNCFSYVSAVAKKMKDGLAIFSCDEYLFSIEKERDVILDFHYESIDRYFQFSKYIKSKNKDVLESIQFFQSRNCMFEVSSKIVKAERLKRLGKGMHGTGIGRKILFVLILIFICLLKYECSLKKMSCENKLVLSELQSEYISLDKKIKEKSRIVSDFACADLHFLLKELFISDPSITISKIKVNGHYFELEGECSSAIATSSALNRNGKFSDIQLGTVISLSNGKEKISLKGKIHED